MGEPEREDGHGEPGRPKKKTTTTVALRVGIGGVGALVFAATSAFAYVNLTYKRDFSAVPLPDIKASQDPAVIARGAYVVNAVAHCSA